MSEVVICQNCNKKFKQWRKKKYCSERCADAARQRRLRAYKQDSEGPIPDSLKLEKIDEQNQETIEAMSRYEPSRDWVAVNEITQKLVGKNGTAIAWAIYIDRAGGWFGRVGNDMSWGPTSLNRARESVETYLRCEPFEERKGERSWRGNCMGII